MKIMAAIPTYVQQEIRKCLKKITLARTKMKDPHLSALQRLNMRRSMEVARKRMMELEKRPLVKGR